MLFSRVVAGMAASIFFFTNALFVNLPQQTVWSERSKKNFVALPAVTSSLLALSPVPSAAPNAANLPAAFLSRVVIQEQRGGSRLQKIVLLQDVHGNSEAQQNIAQALLALRTLKASVTV